MRIARLGYHGPRGSRILGELQLIEFPASAISTWGGVVVFGNVLLTRLGVPVPAVPVLLFAGVAIVDGKLSFWYALAAAVLGALLGDGIWFMAGRLYGRKLIQGLARLSAAVEIRVRKARALLVRFGPAIVSVSKFVPGLGIITPPLMGTTRVDTAVFFAWDAAGIVAWATFWLLGGALFERHLAMLLAEVRSHGGTVIDVLLALAGAYAILRLLQRMRAQRLLAHERVTPEQVEAMMRPARPPTIIDARPEPQRQREPFAMPGLLQMDIMTPAGIGAALDTRNDVVYCVCPDQATALALSRQMRDKGFRRIRALNGGLDAWERRGYAIGSVPFRATQDESLTLDGAGALHPESGVTLRCVRRSA
jgi:membrane protein DedA with SNARE-associated domain/rhodanese-related sulfurtransferase